MTLNNYLTIENLFTITSTFCYYIDTTLNLVKGECNLRTKMEQIHDEITHLDGNVLSVYLNTNPGSEDWKIRLKNGLQKMEEYVAASNPEQVKEFKKICKKVSSTIKDNQMSFTNSLICLASTKHLYIYFLQIPVENDFQWREGPATEQLQILFEEFSKSGVVLLQRDKITLITSSLGELVHVTHYEFDLEKEDWKQYKGVAFANVYSSSANHREKFDRRIRENQARWYKRIAPAIERYARSHQWKNVHLAGPAELTKEIKQHLHLNITGETTRNYSGKSAHAVLEKTVLI